MKHTLTVRVSSQLSTRMDVLYETAHPLINHVPSNWKLLESTRCLLSIVGYAPW